VEPPTRTLPTAVAVPVAVASEAVWRLFRLGGEPPATRFAVWLSSQECTIDISKARRELGYEPIKDRETGLAELSA
jgi:nucleoside-diphosphate-sugar epimerase